MTDHSLHRILYADDEPDVREVARVALELVGGFTLGLCASGAEVLEKAPSFAPDLILLDVMMPGMDGPATLAALRNVSSLSQIPVVFITAKAQAAEFKRLRDLGVADVITKPFEPMKLPEKLRAIWQTLSQSGCLAPKEIV